MKNESYLILAVLVILLSGDFSLQSQVPSYLYKYKDQYNQDARAANLQWFKDARFGMFIHYGLYSQTAHPVTDPPMEITNSPTFHETPLLYNLNVDPSEKFNIADEHPEIIAEIRKVLEEHLAGIEPAENQLEKLH